MQDSDVKKIKQNTKTNKTPADHVYLRLLQNSGTWPSELYSYLQPRVNFIFNLMIY